MSNDDYKQGYKDGWKDGYEQSRKDHLPITYPVQPTPPWHNLYGQCHVCHMDYKHMTGYVCPRMDCPTKITCGTTAIRDPGLLNNE